MKKYGVLAYPAKHSLSPVMHNAAFKELGIDAQYGVFNIPEMEVNSFIESVKHEPISGLSVSLPYKISIMKYLNEINTDAQKIGAVNTVHNKGGILYGYNTDFIGSNRALKEAVGDLKEKIVVIIGAGGVGRAIAYGLMKEGAHVWIKNRTKSKADSVAIEFAENFNSEIHSDAWDHWGTGDILIHATSIWYKKPDMNMNELPEFCDAEFLNEFDYVMDASYNLHMENFDSVLLTPLLQKAKEANCEIITGEKMLLYQAMEQFKIWTGQDAPMDIMKKALLDALGV